MGSSINIFQRLRSLVPLPSVYVGVVLEIHEDDHTSTVQIPGPDVTDYAGNVAVGSILRPRGTSVPVGHRAFVRAGVIETEAPDGDILDIEVGKIIVIPPPPVLTEFSWLDTFTGSAGSLFGHIPDIYPSGWEWASSDIELDGLGGAVTTTLGSVTASSGGTWAPIVVEDGVECRFEFDVTMSDVSDSQQSYTTLYFDSGTDTGGYGYLQIDRTNEGDFFVNCGFGSESSGDGVVVDAAGFHEFVVLINGSTVTVTMDGVTVLTLSGGTPLLEQIGYFDITIHNGSSQSHTIQRAAIHVA